MFLELQAGQCQRVQCKCAIVVYTLSQPETLYSHRVFCSSAAGITSNTTLRLAVHGAKEEVDLTVKALNFDLACISVVALQISRGFLLKWRKAVPCLANRTTLYTLLFCAHPSPDHKMHAILLAQQALARLKFQLVMVGHRSYPIKQDFKNSRRLSCSV